MLSDILYSFCVTVTAVTLIFVSGRDSAFPSSQVGNSCSIHLVKSFKYVV